MAKRQSILYLAILTSLMLVLSACGPRATGGSTIDLAGSDAAALDLPAIVVDYDTAGSPSVGGMPLSSLAGLLGISPDVATQLQLDPELITELTKANIQHAQLDNATDGIQLLVNGQPLPSLVWDENSLVTAANVMEKTGFGVQQLETVLPLIRTIGVGTIVRIPIAADAELIPAVVTGEGSVAAVVQTSQLAHLNTVGNTAQLKVNVIYDEDGTWTVAGMDATQWSQVVPAPWEDLNLTRSLIEQLSTGGISTIQFSTNSDGLFVAVNEENLPHLGWSQGELQHLLNLVSQPDLLAYITGVNNSNLATSKDFIDQWLPILQTANVQLTVTFP